MHTGTVTSYDGVTELKLISVFIERVKIRVRVYDHIFFSDWLHVYGNSSVFLTG